MPADFERCVRQGGKVITRSLAHGRYIHICYLGNKSFAGEVKTKKPEGGKTSGTKRR